PPPPHASQRAHSDFSLSATRATGQSDRLSRAASTQCPHNQACKPREIQYRRPPRKCSLRTMLRLEPCSSSVSSTLRPPPQVLAVQLQQIEGAMHSRGFAVVSSDQVKNGKPAFVANFAVDQA